MATNTNGIAGTSRQSDSKFPVELRIDIPERGAAFNAIPAGAWISPDCLHWREVNNHSAVIATDKVLVAMPAAPNRHPQTSVIRLLQRLHNLGGIATKRNVRRISHPAQVEATHQCRIPRIGRQHALALKGETGRGGDWGRLGMGTGVMSVDCQSTGARCA